MKKIMNLSVVLSVLLVGCSSKSSEQELIKAQQSQFQMEELATVIAGGTFLSEKCAEPNILKGEALQNRVLETAAMKGFDVQAYLDPSNAQYQQLNLVSKAYYQEIIQDPNSTLPYNLRKNCTKLKQMLAPFL